jgi:hypothetical protein
VAAPSSYGSSPDNFVLRHQERNKALFSFRVTFCLFWFQPDAEAVIKELDAGLFESGARSFQETFFLQPIGHDLLNKMRHWAPVVFCRFFERRFNILIETNT